MEATELKRIKELEEENVRLKRMYANVAMELEVAKYILEKKVNSSIKKLNLYMKLECFIVNGQ